MLFLDSLLYSGTLFSYFVLPSILLPLGIYSFYSFLIIFSNYLFLFFASLSYFSNAAFWFIKSFIFSSELASKGFCLLLYALITCLVLLFLPVASSLSPSFLDLYSCTDAGFPTFSLCSTL